jgi:hypothetical protein
MSRLKFEPASISHKVSNEGFERNAPHDENGLETASRVKHSGRSADRAAPQARAEVSGLTGRVSGEQTRR